MLSVIAFIFGVAFGILIAAVGLTRTFVGTLRMKQSDNPAEAPYLFVDLDKHPAAFMTERSFVMLKVDAGGYIPHK